MKITRIEIKGFKSYANRVVITGFDPMFNAITGPNGSGKSNILDAICFVLGISNLSLVRAANMGDLVYKQGQTGVTMASVTITFEVKQDSPIDGRTNFVVRRQVSVNGSTSYMLNGKSATNTRVVDFFRSVGLNINNPHFLIMQGRVTKVLNMKPPEILGMIEEAAGTRLYDDKVAKAQATIMTKDNKMDDIVKIIRDDLEPKLQRLHLEKENYNEYQKLTNQLEVDGQRVRRAEYALSKKKHSQFLHHVKRMENEVSCLENEIEKVNDKIEAVGTAHQNLEMQRAQANVGDLRELQDDVEETSRYVVTLKAEIDLKKKNKQSIKLSMDRLTENIDSDKKDIKMKIAELAQKDNEFGGREAQGAEAEKAVERAREKLTALAQGMTTNERGEAASIDAQLTEAKSALSSAHTLLQTKGMRLRQLRPVLDTKTNQLNRLSSSQQGQLAEIEEAGRKADLAKMELDSIDFDKTLLSELLAQDEQLHRECGALKSRIECTRERCRFAYKCQQPRDLDERKVRGTVISMIRPKDMKYAKALETIGKSALHDLVVDDSETAKTLIRFGGMQYRVRMLPLNTLRPSFIDKKAFASAQHRYGRENVMLAKDLLEYDAEFEPAIAYIFGSVVVCTDLSIAKRVPFELGLHCVTLDGDYVNPSGVLSGGATRDESLRLLEYEALRKEMETLETKQAASSANRAQIERLQRKETEFQKANKKYEHLRRTLTQLQERMAVGTVSQLNNEIADLENEIRSCEQEIAAAREEIPTLTEKVKKLEEYKGNEKEFRGKEKIQAQEELRRAERLLRSVRGGSDKSKEILDVLRAEISSMENDVVASTAELENKRTEYTKCQEELQNLQHSLGEAKESCANAKLNRDNVMAKARDVESAIRNHLEEIKNLKKLNSELVAKRRDADNERAEFAKTAQTYLRRMDEMKREYRGISEECEGAGADIDYNVVRQELDAKGARLNELKRIVNPKVMEQLSGAAERLSVLQNKLDTLKREKKTLLSTIGMLNVKRETVILRAHNQVNQDFGGIFSSLLPGAMTSLVPPKNEKDALSGLEIKVGFNNKWKEGLQELSGGQRSLVALSLILAMLKFNPAPMYILDEVDAALDISHTRNIGKMIRDHFKESQFIVVSLKDDLFNHANVLFRTKFVNGSSTVMQTTNEGNDQSQIAEGMN